MFSQLSINDSLNTFELRHFNNICFVFKFKRCQPQHLTIQHVICNNTLQYCPQFITKSSSLQFPPISTLIRHVLLNFVCEQHKRSCSIVISDDSTSVQASLVWTTPPLSLLLLRYILHVLHRRQEFNSNWAIVFQRHCNAGFVWSSPSLLVLHHQQITRRSQ